MNDSLIKDLLTTQIRYRNLHFMLSSLEEKAADLARQHESLHSQLVDTRNLEQELINKIEEELGKTVTANDLMELIKTISSS